MNIIDLHQDILIHERDPNVYKYKNQTSIQDILKSNIKLVFGTGFVLGPDQNCFDEECLSLIQKDIEKYNDLAEANENLLVIRNATDISVLLSDANKKGIIIHIEGLNTFTDTPESWSMLENFYENGLRSIGIVWTKANSLGGGNDDASQGLTDLGRKVIAFADEKGILVDYAHMNEQTFFDTLEISKRPIFISHGNAKAICDCDRNYSDEQLLKVRETGGIIGVFFANSCLVKDGMATIEDVVKHILYIKDLIGIEHVAIGSDLGGLILNIPENLRNVFELVNLKEALLTAGLREDEVGKILFGNALRFLQENFDRIYP